MGKPRSKFSFTSGFKPIIWRVSLIFTCEKMILSIRSCELCFFFVFLFNSRLIGSVSHASHRLAELKKIFAVVIQNKEKRFVAHKRLSRIRRKYGEQEDTKINKVGCGIIACS